MRIPLLPFFFMLVVSVLIDWYIWAALSRRCRSRVPARVQLISAAALLLFIIVTVALPRRGGSDDTLRCIMWMMFTYISVYASKLIFVIIDLLARIPRLWHARRLRWLSHAGVVLGCLLFGAMWWGALINRFNYQVREADIYIRDLPPAFENFTIAQISDLHVGTYGNDTTYVSHIVDMVNSLHPDLIVFTGDIVNRHTGELPPHVSPLSRLHAPYGVYSILGNHDYGDYCDWPSDSDKARNMERMVSLQRDSIGWRLLLNEHDYIVSGRDSIALIGVENVGDPPFTIYGSLSKAYPAAGDSMTKILLSHNPAHWVDSISGNDDANIALTLSGHTHAMQMEVAGISPAALRYRTWGGLYDDSSIGHTGDHRLYVNIGIGAVGMPMRIGATPEITLLTLRRKQ